MLPDERNFLGFASGIYRGLYHAAIGDIDVFLLANTGLLLGSRNRRLQALGLALGGYVVFRRLDGYVGTLDSKLGIIAKVMHESNAPVPLSGFELKA